jgi:protein-tyrosine phosphatase
VYGSEDGRDRTSGVDVQTPHRPLIGDGWYAMSWIASQFGTFRGAVRLILSYGQVAAGATPRTIDWTKIDRLVFVCRGNICRSAFADIVAREQQLPSASFGLSTTTGLPADTQAIKTAMGLNVDMSRHTATNISEFVGAPGDLLLAMEVRQVHWLRGLPQFDGNSVTLLGNYASPILPHLHDPVQLSPAYMDTCLRRIKRAVATVARHWHAAH